MGGSHAPKDIRDSLAMSRALDFESHDATGAHVYIITHSPFPVAHPREALAGRIPVRGISPIGPHYRERVNFVVMFLSFPVSLRLPTEYRNLRPGSYSYVSI